MRHPSSVSGTRSSLTVLGVHWLDLDEDISAEGMLDGIPAHRPSDKRSGGGRPRLRHSNDPGTAGTPGCHDDDDLYPRAQSGRPWRPESVGPGGTGFET